MAMKWVDQTPQPVTAPAVASQIRLGCLSPTRGAKQVDGRQARQQNAGRQHDQPVVVLCLKAFQNPQHTFPRLCSP